MQLSIPRTPEISQIQQLVSLVPPELRSQITIVPFDRKSSSPIATQRIERGKFSIQIDFDRWQLFAASQRDLLFWNEVARIQGRAVPRSSWEIITIGIGISASLMELPSHSLLAISIALSVAGLASFRLYQRTRGEESLRSATTADRAAIDLAMQFGYSFAKAYSSLYEALRILAKHSTQKSQWNKYQVRLRVLEILASSRDPLSRSLVMDVGTWKDRENTENIRRNTRSLVF